MNEIETAWVAGLLEGEGCFSARRVTTGGKWDSPVFTASCGMTDEDTIRKLHRIVGFGNVHVARRCDPRRENAKLMYTWNGSRRTELIPFLHLIRPHMSNRRAAKIDEILRLSAENPVYQPAPYEHGTTRTYVKGCRCDPCRKANTVYNRNRRQGVRHDPSINRMPRATADDLLLIG